MAFARQEHHGGAQFEGERAIVRRLCQQWAARCLERQSEPVDKIEELASHLGLHVDANRNHAHIELRAGIAASSHSSTLR